MDRTVKPLLLCLISAMLAGGVHAAITNGNLNAYKVIVDRNPFGLKPPPPPKAEEPPTTPPPPTTEVSLTGITSMFGKTKAYLVAKERGKNESEYLSLAVGEIVGVVEVLDIDEKAGTVKIKNSGVETVLNFKDNGVKSVAMAAPQNPGVPAPIPGRPMIGLPQQGANTGRTPVPLLVPGQSSSGSSTMPTLQNIPSRTPRITPGPSSQNTTVPHPDQSSMTAEQSEIIVAAQTEANRDKILKGEFPPMPPTSLTPHPPMPPSPFGTTSPK